MRRLLLVCVCLAGCSAPPPEAPPPDDGRIEYAGWARLTDKPVLVAFAAWSYCREPGPDVAKESKRLGPHFAPAIKVYANPAAQAHLRGGGSGPLPAGSIIVKEKVSGDRPNQAYGYAAMIKREAGYDPEHGDWEYVYAGVGEGGQVERGKLESCIACHAGQAKQDYLFRNYEKADKQ